jgi:hypothetical protein
VPSDSQEKRPAEVIRLGADFSQAFLLGEAIVPANVTVSVRNLLTDADNTGTIKVTGSEAITSPTMTARFQAGMAGDLYEVLFDTGATNFANRYTTTVNLIITNTPVGDLFLTSLDTLKQRLRIDPADTSDDALLTTILQMATSYVQGRTARTLFFQTFVEDIYIDDGEECDVIQLFEYPVRQVDTIMLMPCDLQNATQITDMTSYAFNESGELRFRHTHKFFEEPNFNRISYRAGYGRIPDDLAQATSEVSGVFYRDIGREGLSRERIGDYTWERLNPSTSTSSLTKELSNPAIEGILRRYCRTAIWRF